MKNKIILSSLLALSCVSAHAEQVTKRGWYIGGAAGTTSYNEKADIVDSSDSSFSVFGGYRFNRYLAVQGSYMNLGEYVGEGEILKSVDFNGFNFTAVGILPIGNQGFELYGRLGLGLLKYTQNFVILNDELKNTSVGDTLVSAVGLSYTPTAVPHLSVMFGYENYYFQTDKEYVVEESKSNSIGVASIGARFNF